MIIKSVLGFIGLGNMGASMAKNLIKNGHNLIVYDVNQTAVNDLIKIGNISSYFI